MQPNLNSSHYLYKAYQLAQVLSEAVPLGELSGIAIGLGSGQDRESLVWDLRGSGPSLDSGSASPALHSSTLDHDR